MNVTRTAVLGLFKALNIKGITDKVNNKALKLKVSKIKHVLEDVEQSVIDDLDETNESLLTDIVHSFNNQKGVRVVDDAVLPKEKGSKVTEPEEEEDEDTEEESDEDADEDEENDEVRGDEPESEPAPRKGRGRPKKEVSEEPVKKSKGRPKKVEVSPTEEEIKGKKIVKTKGKEDKLVKKSSKEAPGRSNFERVGIVAFIEETIKGTSKTKPLQKQEVLDKLIKKFPNRDAKGMKHTVDVQLNYPKYSSLFKKGMNIVKTEKGYYLSKNTVPETNGHSEKTNGKSTKKVEEKPKKKVKV